MYTRRDFRLQPRSTWELRCSELLRSDVSSQPIGPVFKDKKILTVKYKHRTVMLCCKKGRLVGLFQHCNRRLIVLLPPNEFLHSSPEASRTIQARGTSASEGRNYYQGIQLANPEFTKVKLGHGTDSFTSPPNEGMLRVYSDTRKIQRLRPGSNPRTRVPAASMLTTRRPKPSTFYCNYYVQNFSLKKNCSFVNKTKRLSVCCVTHGKAHIK